MSIIALAFFMGLGFGALIIGFMAWLKIRRLLKELDRLEPKPILL